MLSNEIQAAIDMLRKSKAESMGVTLTPERALEERHTIDDVFRDLPVFEQVTIDVIKKDGLSGEFYTYDENDPMKKNGKVLLFIHGGGFMNGSVLSRRKLCNDIMKEAKMDAFSVEYGQWPEAKHPQGLEDCILAYDYLQNIGYDAKDISVFGESAGAMLTLTMILKLKDENRELPAKAVVFSPVAGQKIDLKSHVDREDRDPMISYIEVVPYYENSDFLSPYVSPAYGDYTNFPKLSIHVGTEEVLFDDSQLIYERCIEAGVDVSIRVWEGLFHVFPLFDSPETDLALKEIGSFLRND